MFVCLSVCLSVSIFCHFKMTYIHTAIESSHNTEQDLCVDFQKISLFVSYGCVKFPCSPPSLVSIFKSVCLSVYDFNTTNTAIKRSRNIHQKISGYSKNVLVSLLYLCQSEDIQLSFAVINVKC